MRSCGLNRLLYRPRAAVPPVVPALSGSTLPGRLVRAVAFCLPALVRPLRPNPLRPAPAPAIKRGGSAGT
jgi:hypothetical protein